jgi:rhodanese-related sulfurtransferase
MIKGMNRLWVISLALILGAAACGGGFGATCAQNVGSCRIWKAEEVQRIEAGTLKSLLKSPNLLILDVRADKDWAASDKKIKNTVHKDPADAASWITTLPKDRRIVLYCDSPGEATSAGVGAKLMNEKFPEVLVLKGGFKGWVAAGYPTEPKW